MITGTFLDEITHDIPFQNWGRQEWERDFRYMKAIGIDTVILIRAGYQERATFNSKVLAKELPFLIVQEDLVQLFLECAEQNQMSFYFGTYDSGKYWHSGQPQREVDINRAFTDEVWERYGHMPAFKGWYISHEINSFDDGIMKVYEQLARHLRGLKNLPILISPYIRGRKQFDDAITLEQHEKEWEQVFSRIQGLVDVVAFQDGQIAYDEIEDFFGVNARLARKYGLKSWSNVESFDRDMPYKFPPIGWPKMRFKMEEAAKAGVDKLITFEFSHFMSPQSMYPSAHTLYKRYCEQYCPSALETLEQELHAMRKTAR